MGREGEGAVVLPQYGISLPGNEIAFKGLLTMDIRLILVLE